jgi:hypothetical protein
MHSSFPEQYNHINNLLENVCGLKWIKYFPFQSMMGNWSCWTCKWCPQCFPYQVYTEWQDHSSGTFAHWKLFRLCSSSSTPVVLEIKPQACGILIGSWCVCANSFFDRAVPGTFWDKSFVLETIRECHKYLSLICLECFQEQVFCLPLWPVIILGTIKLLWSPHGSNLSRF